MPSRHSSNRREFLQGRAAAEAIASSIDRILPQPDVPPSTVDEPRLGQHDDRYLVQFARAAMACQFAVLLNAGQYEHGSEAALAALDVVQQLEDQLTVYRDTSEVMRVNRTAASTDVELDPGLFDLLSLAVRISAETSGAFDVTAGPLVKAWGFFKRSGQVPPADVLRAALDHVGSRHLVLDDLRRTIRFDRPGLELNLGAIGKGYALDRASKVLRDTGVNDFLLHGGQSSVVARGARGGGEDGGWNVGLGDPLRPDRRLAEITLRDRALATSGAAHQFFRHEGKRYGHILDPRTGWPAEGVFSSTVVAPSAAEADALSTAFYALGVDAAQAHCREHAEIGMILLVPGKGQSSVEMATAGLAEQDWRLLT